MPGDLRAKIYRIVFTAAAIYNVAFGLWAALFPRAFFNLFDLDTPRYPAIWACLGMVVGLYGVVYAYAAWRLDRAAPLIAIGLAGKVLGPIGWVMAVRDGELPFRTFPLIVFDDLIWWLPFGLFLLEGTRVRRFLADTAAWWCAALHVVAAIGTLFLLRGGSEAGGNVTERAAWLATHSMQWRLGWMIWMAAAVSLLAFYGWWGARASARHAVAALVIAAAGLACDFAGESIFIGWIPAPDSDLHRAAALLTGGAGNGLYTVAGILLTLVTPRMPRVLRAWAWLVWASGAALTVATIVNVPAGVVAASAALMVLFIPWVLAAGMRLR
jgi:hypothetical protein